MKVVNLVASAKHEPNYLDGDFIGVDRGSEYLYDLNIKMVAMIGDFDSIDINVLTNLKNDGNNIVQLNVVKDNTDLDEAIKYAYSLGYEQINIYGALGQRVDHTLTNINLLKKNRDVILYDDYSCIKILKAGQHLLEKDKFNFVSFYAIENDTKISLINFKYPLNNYSLLFDDTLCISNEIKDNAQIKCNKDIIVVLSR
ncbi:MAG: thiamine diphosphokinase [Bacilli bacterium]|jgi:thiamine pyrophosphokinase|nr:thiamine diphosphokinase [Bacilli bacterium]